MPALSKRLQWARGTGTPRVHLCSTAVRSHVTPPLCKFPWLPPTRRGQGAHSSTSNPAGSVPSPAPARASHPAARAPLSEIRPNPLPPPPPSPSRSPGPAPSLAGPGSERRVRRAFLLRRSRRQPPGLRVPAVRRPGRPVQRNSLCTCTGSRVQRARGGQNHPLVSRNSGNCSLLPGKDRPLNPRYLGSCSLLTERRWSMLDLYNYGSPDKKFKCKLNQQSDVIYEIKVIHTFTCFQKYNTKGNLNTKTLFFCRHPMTPYPSLCPVLTDQLLKGNHSHLLWLLHLAFTAHSRNIHLSLFLHL